MPKFDNGPNVSKPDDGSHVSPEVRARLGDVGRAAATAVRATADAKPGTFPTWQDHLDRSRAGPDRSLEPTFRGDAPMATGHITAEQERAFSRRGPRR
jgi:hypothetical protein